MALVVKIKSGIHAISIRKVLIIAFSIRIAWYLFILFTNPGGFWLYDSNGYWNLAYNLKEYGIFSQTSDTYQEPLLPDYFRTPLYPFLIYPTLWVDMSGSTVPLINIVFDCLTCWLIYKTVYLIVKNENYAKAGSLVYAIHIPAVLFSSFVLTETVFAFLILLFVYLFFKCNLSPGWKNGLLCGFAGGLCVMCKPLGFVLIFPAIIFLLVRHKLTVKALSTVCIMVLAFYAVQFPWMQRNKNTFGRYFNSVLGEHLILGYHAAHVYAKANHVNYFDAKEMLINECFQGIDYDPYKHPYEYAKRAEQKAYEVLWNNKFIFLREHSKECIKFFLQPMKMYTTHQLGKHAYTKFVTWCLVALQVCISFVLLSTIAFALYRYLRRQLKLHWFTWFLLVLMLLFAQFNTMPYTDARMRLPVDPLLIVLFVLVSFALAPAKNTYNQQLKLLFTKRSA
ncbi:MAG TPA: glycosyltransferase family 39 protein [Flavobacteriales bacterium]|nr:glycosyltransferase family 39 protein [Flavobacteriales bacterium]